jgi:Immunity protein 50
LNNIESFIQGSEKLTNIFGYWPSFHDAEVHALNFRRSEIETERNIYVFPVLKVKIHLWELTDESNPAGFLARLHHTLATICFKDVHEFEMSGFNHQKAILSLSIAREARTEGPSPVFKIRFDEAYGMQATLICSKIEIVTAVVCDENGTERPAL